MNMLTLLQKGNHNLLWYCRGHLHRFNSLREIPSTISTYWLAKEYEEHRIVQNHPNTAQSPTSRLWYLFNYHDALQAHMHPLHKLGNASTVANYHEYFQNLIKNGTANGAASNAYLTASCVPVETKCISMKYRTEPCTTKSMRCGLST